MMKPTELIANAIRREREQAGVSLSALAVKANLAKSTLSQLEAGKGNPSIETLWAIASALDIPFSFLFETGVMESHLIRAEEGVPLGSDVAEFSVVMLSKCPPGRRRDLYRYSLTKGAQRDSEPHPVGTIEHAYICSGRVRLGPVGAMEEVGPGDYFCYPADIPHSYVVLTDKAVILLAMESAV
ncbi:MAG: XRE family transcriptional regulator [Alphaproteobacteria bacterium]|nr:MAG: XRE family transcriptional regulator [Alphaproteobacteria bacterium]